MNRSRFDRLVQNLGAEIGRRTLLQGAAALGAVVAGRAVLHDVAEAKILCRKTGASCNKKSKRCKAEFCLKAPFTIEARWSNPSSDHDSFLFLPKMAGSNDPSPFISFHCNPGETNDCEDDVYPFICVSQDAAGPGDEITTVRRLLAGAYEYWIELAQSAPAGDLKVILRNANGRAVRSWSSPANPDADDEWGWHVFSIDGARRSIASVDTVVEVNNSSFVNVVHTPNTNVCPGMP
jgi:hypothetical protein